ncbi:MAG: ArsC family reductase [Lautropia sp.]|nr:ArsC family reductase [Lautropia sp.]
MTVTVYGIPNCDQIRKTRQWLADAGVEFRFHDYRKDGLDRDTLAAWVAAVGADTLLNRRGTTWRALSDTQKAAAADPNEAIALMLAQPALIKRPVVRLDAQPAQILVGFSADALKAALAR